MRFALLAVLAFASGTPSFAQAVDQPDDTLRINQIQVIGTHNSYHAGLTPAEAKFLADRNPRTARALDYRHPPLAKQLDAGIRQVELDVFFDPKGGRYGHPANLSMIAASGAPVGQPYDPQHAMDKPGFKVMHVQDLDQRSTCPLFTECLEQIRDWSMEHPQHLPVFILVETKQGAIQQMPRLTEALPFTPAVFDALEAEILSVFSREQVITPDEVRGKDATLPEAIAHGGWPTLAQARGKVVFLLDQRSNEPIYTQAHAALRGRLMFTNATPGAPDAAFTEENDAQPTEIDDLARRGYLIRTRTDADTVQARTNDTARRDAVLSSGAQILSSDYPASEPATWTGYSVGFPGNEVARCNPVTAPKPCSLPSEHAE